MELKQLTSEEVAILDDPLDAPLVEILNGFTLNELEQIDNAYTTTDFKHYVGIQRDLWMEKEKYLISKRPGHDKEVTSDEVVEDMKKYNNGLRYKAWYVLKFPQKVKRKGLEDKFIAA